MELEIRESLTSGLPRIVLLFKKLEYILECDSSKLPNLLLYSLEVAEGPDGGVGGQGVDHDHPTLGREPALLHRGGRSHLGRAGIQREGC